jgi:hypothetical protein
MVVSLCIAACSNPEGTELLFTQEPPDKHPPRSNAIVRVGVYIDTDNSETSEILADTGNYVLKGSNTLYFDYVIIGGASIKQGSVNAYISYSEPLLKFLRNWKIHIKPLRDKGIKVLLGIKGGKEGVCVGSLTKAEQPIFARECVDVCKYYGLDGIEFYDVEGESNSQSPYPEIGTPYWDGEKFVQIPNIDGELKKNDAWKKGGGNMTDMMSYLIESFGAVGSFQGDIPPDIKEKTPILVREVGFGKHLPPAVPRYAFATTLSCLTYSINNDPDLFGADDEGKSYMDFIGTRTYAPAMINLTEIDMDILDYISEELGNNGNCQYGLIYYTNLQPYSSDSPMPEYLSSTSKEVFGKEVSYIGKK